MTFSKLEKLKMNPEQRVGVAIKVVDAPSRAMHVGLLYVNSSGETCFAHLAFHRDLRNDPCPSGQGYLWSVCMWLEDPMMSSNAKFMANYIEAIAVHAGEVDYGTNPSEVGFDNSGQYFSLDPRRGLTCATFVSAVFQSAGFPIVNLSTWPLRDSDVDWRDHVLNMLRLNGADDRANEIADEVVPFRLTPAEAAVAASADVIPLDCETAVQLSQPLLQELFVGAPA